MKDKKRKRTAGARGSKMDAAKTKKLLLIITAAFLGLVLLLGCVFGVASAIKRSSYVMYYKGVGIDRGVANFLCTYYKGACIRILNEASYSPVDNAQFWETVYDEKSGETFGNFLDSFVTLSIKNLIAANVIFDTDSSLTASDKNKISLAVEERLTYLYNGKKSEFNKAAAQYGFDYNDFEAAMKMVYKMDNLQSRVFGADGSGVLADLEYCEEFFSGYSRVKFIFIRTENTVYRDEDGAPVIENGSYAIRELTESERAERAEVIEDIKLCIDEINSKERDPEAFDNYAKQIMELYGEIESEEVSGYYLYNGSVFTEAFAKDYPEVAKEALSLASGECSYVLCDNENGGFKGICFMYRDEVEHGTYPYYYDTAEGGFFTDFTLLAAKSLTSSMIDMYAVNVEISDKWEEISLTDIPYTMSFWLSFS